MAPTIVLRIQSATEGTKRVEVFPNATTAELHDTVKLPFHLNVGQFSLYRERNYTAEVVASKTQTITSLGLKNGDFLYLKANAAATAAAASVVASGSSTSIASLSGAVVEKSTPSLSGNNNKKTRLVEDEVDVLLSKLPGTIARKRDPKLCRHSSNGCCVHCSPLEPWDDNYLKEHKIKHMSFHAYLRKLTSGVSSGKFAALDDLNCRIKSGCTDHLPWPKGICSKCQPSAITLNRQLYRHVDNVRFENASLVERFLNYWRKTGHQRLGMMYGTYEVHADVPLGLRANVRAIYEPPQENARDWCKLLDDPAAQEVDAIAAALGMTKVGWIFTDLLSDNSEPGAVKHIRGADTFFLSAEECILAGHLQNRHPNASRHASGEGTFGSKFVTVCVTGDAKKQVHMEGYAVSAQCMALVRDDCLVPTKDAPELGYIRESSDKQYVPDVYYKQKDQYGNEVSRLARPLPVEYLLVDVPASTPLVPIHTFTVRDDRAPFPIENRYLDGHVQDFNALSVYLSQWSADEFLAAVSDFHFLLYLSHMDVLPIRPILNELLAAVRQQDLVLVEQFKTNEVWSTLETLIAASANTLSPPSTSSGGGAAGRRGFSSAATTSTGSAMSASALSGMQGAGSGSSSSAAAVNWTCDHCTFINGSSLDACEMCGLPRS